MAIIALYSAKGGVGKTASSVNLAWLSAKQGARTLLWDLDAQAAASFYLRVPAELPGGIEGLLRGKTALFDAVRSSHVRGLDVLPGHFSYRLFDRALDESGAPERLLARVLEPLARSYDTVFLDCPPGIGSLAEGLFATADCLLVPTIPTTLSLRTLAQLMAHLKRRERPPRRLCFLTMVDRRKSMHRQVCEWVRTQGLGFLETRVPYASDLEKMGIQPNPVFAYAARSPGARAYEELWREIGEKLRPHELDPSSAAGNVPAAEPLGSRP